MDNIRGASEDEIVFDLATRKGSDLVVNSDMDSGVAITKYTVVLHTRDDAQRSSFGDCAELPQGIGAELWRQLLREYEPGVDIRYGAMLQSLLKRRFGELDETDLVW